MKYDEDAPPEPRVNCADVARILAPHVVDDEAKGILASKADCSMRTLWRVLGVEVEWLRLKLADDLLTASGESVNACRLKHADGTVEEAWLSE